MLNWLVSSIQQYTINRLRVSFSLDYDVSDILKLTYHLYDYDGIDRTDQLENITNSNDWEYTSETNLFDIILKKNSSLTEGTYSFLLYNESGVEIYKTNLDLNYMEDIRSTISNVYISSLNTLEIEFESLYNDIYQTKDMLSIMNISIRNDLNESFSDAFESLADSIISIGKDDPVKHLTLRLKPGCVLPQGYYTIRLTSQYKNRTFSVIENRSLIPFMTTTPPSIGNCSISKKSPEEVILTITFDNYMEKNMMNDSVRKIIDSDGKDISSYFDADRVSSVSFTTAGVSYITKLEIPLITDFYTLEKGIYTISYEWNYDYFDKITGSLNANWCLNELSLVQLEELNYIYCRFAESIPYPTMKSMKYIVELDGERVTDEDILSAFSDIRYEIMDNEEAYVQKFYIDIIDKKKLVGGLYSFILYRDINNDRSYEYIGNINIKDSLIPSIKSVQQTSIDTITVTLSKSLPIEVIEYCVTNLFDSYGGIDFSTRLNSIKDSNVWEPGQTSTDRFNIITNSVDFLSSGKYLFSLSFADTESNKFPLVLSYMETRKGIIQSIKQTSLSTIKVKFSKTQSRQFLLTTKLAVERRIDGADLTDRFELLENVIKADQYVIDELEIPMDNEDSLPAGRYTFSFIFQKENEIDVIYSYDVELGYMTNVLPTITRITNSIDSIGILNMKINFSNYLEKDLFDLADIRIEDEQENDVTSKFISKEGWSTTTTYNKEITLIKSLSIKATSKDITFEKGNYYVTFSWEDNIEYMPELTDKTQIGYILPSTIAQEVVDTNSVKRTARLYFQFPETLQFAFYKDLHVEVIDENEEDHTEYFNSIQKSNNISEDMPDSEKVPTDNINLDVNNIVDLSFGTYTIIFYHEKDGIRTSEYMSKLDIMAALYPSIKTMEQVGTDTLLITLVSSVPRKLLESNTFTFISFKKTNYTNYFKSIDSSNDWDEEIREVSSFYLKLKNGYSIGSGTYSFVMYSGELRLDQCDISIDYMEGLDISIDSIKVVNLSTITLNFSSEQSLLLYKTLKMIITDENGTDISDKFISLDQMIKNIKTDYFESLDLKLSKEMFIPKGNYTIEIVKKNEISEDSILMSHMISLHYMSSIEPKLYNVSATKTKASGDAILMWFSPAIELEQFNHASFIFTNASGMSVKNKFEDISDAILDVTEQNGVTLINYVTLPFNSNYTLDKDTYDISFDWVGEYSYMKKLSCEVSLDYILFPVKSIELNGCGSVVITFNDYVTKEYLKHAKLIVDSNYEANNADGSINTAVDFTKYFMELSESNNFDSIPDQVISIYAKVKDGQTLPASDYRFIIAEDKSTHEQTILQYAYAGTLTVDVFISDDILSCNVSLLQKSYNYLELKFDVPQNINFLNQSTLHIVKIEDDKKIDFTSMFLSLKESNRYNIADETGNVIGYDYYKNAIKRDEVIDELHYTIKETPSVLLKLNNTGAIPSGDYTIWFENRNEKYFEGTVTTTFMTSNPPKISSMTIHEGNLVVTFSPQAEIESIMDSNFNLLSYRGLDADGSARGDDVSNYFGSVMSSVIEKNMNEIGITHVSQISLPISNNAFIASGKYILTWNWSPRSFFPQSTFIGSLSVVAKGIKSATLLDAETIKIELNETYATSYLNALSLSVFTKDEIDVSDDFMDIIDSNPDFKDIEESDSFLIKVEEDTNILTDTYIFTLSYETDSDEDVIQTTAFKFGMNIIYMTDDFPSITRLDNLTNEKFITDNITNSNASNYIGYPVQLFTSDAKEILTEENLSEYMNQYVKVFNSASIDRLIVELDEEIEPCLLMALKPIILTSNGNDISSKFNEIDASNTIKEREVLDFIEFTLRSNMTTDEISGIEISIINSCGEDISSKFLTIDESNEFENDIVNKFKLYVDEDERVEKYETLELSIGMRDVDDAIITGFKHHVSYKKIQTTNQIQLLLNNGETLEPDNYDVTLYYQNEPNSDSSVMITPFKYSGLLPFISRNIGRISSVVATDLTHIKVTFTENLPIKVFYNLTPIIFNEDKEDISQYFKSITDTNSLDGLSYLADLPDPYSIYLELDAGSQLLAGNYTIGFEMDINNVEADDTHEVETYTLWQYTTNLPYMIHDIANSIQSVSIMGINKLKLTLENPIDVNLLKSFLVEIENEDNSNYYPSDTFKKINVSNNLGKYILLTDNRYILYSEDSTSWYRIDTGYSYMLYDIIYDIQYETYIIVCNAGKVLTFKEFNKNSFTTHDTITNKTLTSITRVNNGYLVTGNDGVMLKGTFNGSQFVWKNVATNVTTSITKIAKKSETELVAVGYGGLILYSNNAGDSWTRVPYATTTITPNFTDVIYYDGYLDTETNEWITPEVYGFFVVGTNGSILYSETGKNGFSRITSPTSKSLYSIASHGDTIAIVGDSGTIVVTNDTETWDTVSAGTSSTLRSVEWCDSKFISCASNGKWLSSLSGNAWTINSSIYSDGLKNVKYMPSQYEDNRKIDYFYIELANKQEIGNVGLYSGTTIPDLTNEPARYWISDDSKKSHVGDIYTRYEDINNSSTIIGEYQFVKDTAYDEYGNIVSEEYKWKDCTNESISSKFSGNYTFFVLLNDDSKTEWHRIGNVPLTYLSSDPGEIVSATIESPDSIAGIDYDTPYLSVNINRGNENALYYAYYEFMDENGNDYTNRFLSLRQAEIKYSSGLLINGVNIRGNKNNQSNLPGGDYVFNWKWSKNDNCKIPVKLKTISNIVQSIIRDAKSPNKLIVTFAKEIDVKYFYNVDRSGMNTSKIDIRMYKYPTTSDTDTTYNYFNYFKDIAKSTDFSDPTICQNGKVKKIVLEVDEASSLSSGDYLFKMTNEEFDLSTSNEMYITATKFNIAQEVTLVLPTLAYVKVESCKTVITPISDLATNNSYSGLTKPQSDPTMVNLLASWKLGGDVELSSHVGDRYRDEITDKEYGFNYNKLYGTYQWEEIISNPMLVVAFDNKPTLDNMTRFIKNISLIEYDSDDKLDKDMTSSLVTDILKWEFETSKSNGVRYVSKAFIPLNPATSFYGPSNATFKLNWIDGCIYNDLSMNHLSLSSSIKSYGDISCMTPISIPAISPIVGEEGERPVVTITKKNYNNYIGKLITPINGKNAGKIDLLSESNYTNYINVTVEIYSQEDVFVVSSTGLEITFTNHLYTSFLKKCTFTLTREYEQEDGTMTEEDVAGYFQSIAGANAEEFENNDTTNKIYLLLQDGQSIDPGSYDLIITGEKPSQDLSRNDATIVTLSENNYKKYLDASVRVDGSSDKLVILTDEESSEGYYKNFLNKKLEVYNVNVIFVFENMVIPWTTSMAPSDFKITYYKTKSGFNYPVLRFTFNRETPDLSVVKQFSININGLKSNKDYSSCFRNYKSSILKYNMTDTYDGIVKLTGHNYTNYLDKAVKIVGSKDKPVPLTEANMNDFVNHKVEYYSAVQSIDVPMKDCKALKSGSYATVFNFTGNKLLSSLPVKGITRTFTVEDKVMTKIAKITKITKDKYKLKFALTFKSGIDTNAKLKKSQLGTAMNVKSLTELLKKCKLVVTGENGEDLSDRFNPAPSISGKKVTVTLKPNRLIDPQKVTFVFKYNGVPVTNVSTRKNFTGMIRNNMGKVQGNALCYILEETLNGKTKYRVYSRYTYMQARVNKLVKLNNAAETQYALCKQCRKKKVLSTSKIDASFDAYDIPKGNKGKIKNMMKAFISNHLSKTARPKKCKTINGKLDLKECVGDETSSVSFECMDYVKSKTPYSWKMHIANKGTKLKGKSKTMYVVYLVQDSERFPVVYKATSKGKKSKTCKNYMKKTLPKAIKAYNKKVSVCNKCKKRTIAYKSSTSIDWGAALFDDDIRSYSNTSAICKKVNAVFKSKKMGCAKANFSLVQKNAKYCKLSCKNCKLADRSLAVGCYKGTFKK